MTRASSPGAGGAASPERIGIYLGSALGGIAYAEEQHERYLEKGIRQVAPNLALAVFGGAAPANLGIALDVRGPILSTANSCASGAVALGEALGDLREGRVDAAIAGGCEIPLSPLAFGAFDIIRALSAGHNDDPAAAARPFDVGRDGFVMGEGAALLVLEEAEAAEARGATPYAEILGYGATSDAHHMVQPRADGREAARAATIALEDAAVDPGEIDYVNAHASSTPIGDVAEARAIATALGARAATVPVSRHEGAVRPSARRLGRHRGRHLRAGDPRRLGARVGQPARAGPGGRGAAPGSAARGSRRHLSTGPVHVVRVRRAQRGARVRGAGGLGSAGSGRGGRGRGGGRGCRDGVESRKTERVKPGSAGSIRTPSSRPGARGCRRPPSRPRRRRADAMPPMIGPPMGVDPAKIVV